MLKINGKPMTRTLRDNAQGYPEIGLEILGSPKTVRLEGTYQGDTFSAPMEVWIMALVAVLTPEQKSQFFATLNHVQQSSAYQQIQRAQIVADIPMPDLR